MSTLTLSGYVNLPFTLNICAVGPTVDQIAAHVADADIVITFPSSMTEGAVGKSLYPDGWAWWVVDRFFVEASAAAEEMSTNYGDYVAARDVLLSSAQTTVHRLLNSCRWRLNQPEIHPVLIDPAKFQLDLVLADGSREALPDAESSFFYSTMPTQPPFDSSLTSESIQRIQRDILDSIEPPHADLWELDIQRLEALGETERATELRAMGNKPERDW